MIKNIPVLKYTKIDFSPSFDFHMNAYSWSLLRDALKVESFEEIAYITAYTIEDCPDFPGITPFGVVEEFDTSVEDFKMFKGSIWGTECAIMKKKINQENSIGFVYIRIKDLGLCT